MLASTSSKSSLGLIVVAPPNTKDAKSLSPRRLPFNTSPRRICEMVPTTEELMRKTAKSENLRFFLLSVGVDEDGVSREGDRDGLPSPETLD